MSIDGGHRGQTLEQVLLEVVAGEQIGRKAWIRAGQQLLVGRSESADVSFPGDLQMSSVHFSLQCNHDLCQLTDCNSRNGTYLNNERVDEAKLCDGDRIRAGQTVFRVHVRGGSHASLPQETLKRAIAGTMAPITPAASGVVLRCTRQCCVSGLWAYRPASEKITVSSVAHILAQFIPASLIVAPGELKQHVSTSQCEMRYLFDWLPEELAQRISPVIAFIPNAGVLLSLEASWAADDVIAVFARRERSQVAAQLQRIARCQDPGGPDSPAEVASPKHALGLHQATITANLLTYSKDLAQQLMCGVEVILIKDQEAASWQLFCPEAFSDSLQRFGFVWQDAQQAVVADNYS